MFIVQFLDTWMLQAGTIAWFACLAVCWQRSKHIEKLCDHAENKRREEESSEGYERITVEEHCQEAEEIITKTSYDVELEHAQSKSVPKIWGIDPDILNGIFSRAKKYYKEEKKDPKAFEKKYLQDNKPVKPCIFIKDDADLTSKKDKIREMDRSDVELKTEARDVDGTDFKYGTPKKEDSIHGKDVLECSFSELAHRKRKENRDGAADKESTVDSAAHSDHLSKYI